VTAHGARTHDEDEDEIHLPAPSFAPAVIALGVTIACFGLLTTPILIVAGGAVFLLGLVSWLIDDARGFAQASHVDWDGGEGGHH
jgi:hypothetical protein